MLRPYLESLRLLLAGTLLLGIAYPLGMTLTAKTLFPKQAGGSLIERDGRVVGSVLLGQNFDGPVWFYGRPSATAPTAYEASAGCGTNLSPRNPTLAAQVAARVAALRAADPSLPEQLPADWVTTSASGLDPHISPRAARLQVSRVAAARGLEPSRVEALVRAATLPRWLGLYGEPRVNVLELNLSLVESR
jgi:K+-transporting ATPase ATPase C chain